MAPKQCRQRGRNYGSRLHIITKNTAQVLFNVRQYFKEESRRGSRKNLNNPLLRAVEATGVGKNIISQLNSQSVVDEWKFAEDYTETRDRKPAVSIGWSGIVRSTIRDMFLQEKVMPTITKVYERLRKPDALRLDGIQWPYCRTTLWNFMRYIGYSFEYREQSNLQDSNS